MTCLLSVCNRLELALDSFSAVGALEREQVGVDPVSGGLELSSELAELFAHLPLWEDALIILDCKIVVAPVKQ